MRFRAWIVRVREMRIRIGEKRNILLGEDGGDFWELWREVMETSRKIISCGGFETRSWRFWAK